MDIQQRDENFQKKAINQYEAIRSTGTTNMLDRETVHALALEAGFNTLADVASEHSLYSSLVQNYNNLASKFIER